MIPCDPGEGLTIQCRLSGRASRHPPKKTQAGQRSFTNVRPPSPALALVALGTPRASFARPPGKETRKPQSPGRAATVTLMVPETSAISRSVVESKAMSDKASLVISVVTRAPLSDLCKSEMALAIIF